MSETQSNSLTITRALAELKLLSKRIDRKIRNGTYVSWSTKNNRRKDDPVNDARSHYQSVVDLIGYRNRLKSKVVESNATTNVKIAGQTYTVADAIERKQSIANEKLLLQTLKQQRLSAKQQVDLHNQKERGHLQELLKANFGRDTSKLDPESTKQMEATFWENNKASLIDPLNLDDEIEKLETSIEDFESEVDFVLSESNSQTHIVV